MANHVRDLHGYLKIFHNPLWNPKTEITATTLYDETNHSGLIWGEDYDKLSVSEEDKKAHRDSASVQQQGLSQAIEDDYNVFVLNLAVYKTFASAKKPDVEMIRKCHRKILGLLMFKHTLYSRIQMGNGNGHLAVRLRHGTLSIPRTMGDRSSSERRGWPDISQSLEIV
jgi:hypothetical protein